MSGAGTAEGGESAVRLDHIVVRVASLAASGAWYATLLKAMGFAKAARGWRAADGLTLLLVEAPRSIAGASTGDGLPGLDHLGFYARDRATYEAVLAAMRGAGHAVPEPERYVGEIATFLTDPDGMQVQVSLRI